MPLSAPAIVVAGHGSRDPEGVREFEAFIALLKERTPGRTISHGFLEFSRPTIDEAAKAVVEAGASQVAVVPGVLLAATHAKNDMPSEVQQLRREYPHVAFHFGAGLRFHPSILKLCRERIIEAEGAATQTIPRSETCLVVVGRGTTDPDANSDVSKLARLLEEGMGFGGSHVCYSGTAAPRIGDALPLAARLGYRRLIVFPFFLFTGVLVKRIWEAADALGKDFPRLDVVKAPHLGVHPHLVDALLERADEAVRGEAAMNCSLCKYRTQVIGYEKEVGLPQQGHHFHVRATSGAMPPPAPTPETGPYVPHPIEVQSFEIIEQGRDWSPYPPLNQAILKRLIHTTGDFEIVDDLFLSHGAAEAGLAAIHKRAVIVTDVTMVQSGLRRPLLARLGLTVSCTVHDEETRLIAEASGLTRSATGIRRAWEKYGNDVILLIGDAPTAVEETLRLVREQKWSPHLVVGLPVGFVGTRECKEKLRHCLHIQRITNRGTRGGSPWAASVLNALLIEAVRPAPAPRA